MLIPLLLLAYHGTAEADGVDRLISQLERKSDYKLRLSAAINLGKLGDERAIPALIGALKDSNENVRGAAAASLGTVVSERTDKRTRDRAAKALTGLKRDSSNFVRKQAKRAYDRINSMPSGDPKAGGIYINIGAMSAKAPSAPSSMRKLMRGTAEKTFGNKASSMQLSWPTGKDPSAQQLRKSKVTGYHVDGTLVALESESKGGATLVSCKVSMLIATYPEKSMFGFLDGGARVQAGSSSRDIQYAQEDCVSAVVEDLVTRKIIPVIQQRHP
ncbi:HEAT repeat domain-containing protein [Haliangium ochraceum]|uniref:HEAT repeat domain-containing protein n=1 Tax=Haliangium ochraceum TaxID=80816 RepID=UPI0018EFE2C7|nr:HEAT repeat domain-containing protein [Haliangium ochraceum]